MAKKKRKRIPIYDEIVPALCEGVLQAVRTGPHGITEQSVVTLISRPLWKRWCLACGDPVTCEPTDWLGAHQTYRVFGSRTVVIEDAGYWAVSWVPR